jgi:hypothetical protein
MTYGSATEKGRNKNDRTVTYKAESALQDGADGLRCGGALHELIAQHCKNGRKLNLARRSTCRTGTDARRGGHGGHGRRHNGGAIHAPHALHKAQEQLVAGHRRAEQLMVPLEIAAGDHARLCNASGGLERIDKLGRHFTRLFVAALHIGMANRIKALA